MIDLNNSAHFFLLGLLLIFYGGAGFVLRECIESFDDYTPVYVLFCLIANGFVWSTGILFIVILCSTIANITIFNTKKYLDTRAKYECLFTKFKEKVEFDKNLI